MIFFTVYHTIAYEWHLVRAQLVPDAAPAGAVGAPGISGGVRLGRRKLAV